MWCCASVLTVTSGRHPSSGSGQTDRSMSVSYSSTAKDGAQSTLEPPTSRFSEPHDQYCSGHVETPLDSGDSVHPGDTLRSVS
jgi:hypothetical protein